MKIAELKKHFETHQVETTMVPNENKVGMLITRPVAIDKKCVENENKAAAHQKSFGEVLKSMSADAATEKQKAAKRTGMLFTRLESIDIQILENEKTNRITQKQLRRFRLPNY